MYWFVGLGDKNENGEQLFKIEDDTDGVVEELTKDEIENAVRHGSFIKYREGAVEEKGKYIGKRFKTDYFEYIILYSTNNSHVVFLDNFGLIKESDKNIVKTKTFGKRWVYIKDFYSRQLYKSNNYGDFIIVYVESSTRVHIKFIPSGVTTVVSGQNIRNGGVRYNKFAEYGVVYSLPQSAMGQLYKVWWDMINRCYNESHKFYENYGGKGIYVAEDFLDNEKFWEWCKRQSNLKFHEEVEMQLDKDLSNKSYYGSDSCGFLPHYINEGFVSTKRRDDSDSPRFCFHSRDGIGITVHLRGKRVSSFDISDMLESDDYYYNQIMRFFNNRNITPKYSRKVLVNTAKRWYVAKQMWQEYWCNEFKECLDKGWILQWQYDKLVAMTDIDIAD